MMQLTCPRTKSRIDRWGEAYRDQLDAFLDKSFMMIPQHRSNYLVIGNALNLLILR